MGSKKIDLKDRALGYKLEFLTLFIWGFDNIDTEVEYVTLIINGLEYDNVIGLDLIKDPKDDLEKLQIEQFQEDQEGCPDNKISHFLVSCIETVEIIH